MYLVGLEAFTLAQTFNHIPTLSLSALSREDSGEQAGMGILRYSPVVDEITAAK